MRGNGPVSRHLTEQAIITDFKVNRIMKKLIKYFTEKQKTLFLIDSIGAFITAFFLFVIVQQFNAYFGMPETVLTYLSVIAVCFSVYSIACFSFLKTRRAAFIKLIGIANLLYCVLTMGLLIAYYRNLTITGLLYFSSEMIIICSLCHIELTVAKEIKKTG
jgi:hypothetical protein